MRFWDSSAIVPLCVAQPASTEARALYREDSAMAVWWGSPIECASAIARLHREGVLDETAEQLAHSALSQLRDRWYEVLPVERIREQSFRLLRIHSLRAADALQLAAAVEWAGPPSTAGLITFDERLNVAARLEGFTVNQGHRPGGIQ